MEHREKTEGREKIEIARRAMRGNRESRKKWKRRYK
jgi:hypothetical protein